MAEELKACRYRVEKTGYGFWPYCVRAGDGTRELFKGHQKQCMVVAAELETAFEDGKFVADRANACQGGEAVEVVAWRHWGDKTRLLCDLGKQRAIPGTIADEFTVPLMTVAQHQRILAAGVGIAEPVAMKTHGAWDGLDDLKDLPDGTKLYTHPADQVAEPDAELVALLHDARELIEHGDFREGHCMCGSAVEAHGFGDGNSPVDAGVYYAGQVMERINAKLASMNTKPCQHLPLTSQFGTWCELCEKKLD